MPAISVLMSVYNGEKFLRESIQSVLDQTFDDFEFIIVDDGSTDGTPEILRVFAQNDPRIRIVENTENLGLTKSLNIGLAACRGEYIIRQDADDVSLPDRLEKQKFFMDLNQAIVLGGSRGFIVSENGMVEREKRLPAEYLEIKKKLLFNNQFIHSSLIIRREILLKEGGYNETFSAAQDYELVLRLAAKYPVVNLPEILVRHRLLNAAVSWRGKRQEWDAIRARWCGITKYGYPFWLGILNIGLRLCWLLVPQKIKLMRYFIIFLCIMRKNIILIIFGLVVIIIGIFFWGGWYRSWQKLTADILVKNDWEVEGNGEYNYIVFSSDQKFQTYVFPDENDSGIWSFDEKKLELDFAKQTENRIYTGFEFGRDGALYSITDENRERWVPVKK